MARRFLFPATVIATLVGSSALASAKITIVNGNNPGEGFNDSTAASPVGGNAGITVGQQRLVAFKHAAALWGATLSSNINISIRASFDSLTCSATQGVLGLASPTGFSAGSGLPTNLFYPDALYNTLRGTDPNAPTIQTRFNSSVGNANCLTGGSWYYGLDANHGNGFDLVNILLHEFAHGLGFTVVTDLSSGANPGNPPRADIFQHFLLDLDNSIHPHWDQMTSQERLSSTSNTRRLAWDGQQVHGSVPGILLIGTPTLTVVDPPPVRGDLLVGLAQFGPALTSGGLQGNLQRSSTSDPIGCSPPLASFNNNIALIDRGTCTFVEKVRNAQNANAIAVVIADNLDCSPPHDTMGQVCSPPSGMAGTAPDITIPSVRISLTDANRIKAAMAGGTVTVTVNPRVAPTRSGADANDHPLLYTPIPVLSGSSVVHYDTGARPSLLMGPQYQTDSSHSLDLTRPLLGDIGWTVASADPAAPVADISVAVTASGRASPGSSLTFTVVVTNNGPSDVGDAFALSQGPDGLTFSSNQGDCTTPYPCELGLLRSGASKTINSTFTVPQGYTAPDPIQMKVTALSGGIDNAPTNNVATGQAPLSSSKGCGCSGTSVVPALLPALLLLTLLGRRRRAR